MMHAEAHPLQELTNRTPSPREAKNNHLARAHSPWTAARLKKKGRAASDCILRDVLPYPSGSTGDGNDSGSSPGGAGAGSSPSHIQLLRNPQALNSSSLATPSNHSERTAADVPPPVKATGDNHQQRQRITVHRTLVRRRSSTSSHPRSSSSSSALALLPSSTAPAPCLKVLPDFPENSSSGQPAEASSSCVTSGPSICQHALQPALQQVCSSIGSGSSIAAALAAAASVPAATGCTGVACGAVVRSSACGTGGQVVQDLQKPQPPSVQHVLGQPESSSDGALEFFQEQMDKAAEEGDLVEAQQVWSSMCAADVRPDRCFLRTLLRCWQRGGGNPHDAERLVQDMCRLGGLPLDSCTARYLEAIDIGWQQLAGAANLDD